LVASFYVGLQIFSVVRASLLPNETSNHRPDACVALRAIGHGLEINIGVAGLSLWLRKRDRAIEVHGKLLAAERECREAQIETNGSRKRVAEAMRLAGVDIIPG
jgi:hypothetical protein